MASGRDDIGPNYSDRLLTPVEGSNIVPRLVAARRRFPLRVIVLDDGFYDKDEYVRAVEEACAAWAKATSSVPGGGATMTCERSSDPVGADVIIRLCTRRQADGFAGFTNEYGDWALIRLSVYGEDNRLVTAKRLKRIAMHEFGHALGIWGHSPDAHDVMSVTDEVAEVSSADVNTLRVAYEGRATAASRPVGP